MRYLLLIFFLMQCFLIQAQSHARVDSLTNVVNSTNVEIEKVDAYNDLAWEYRKSDHAKALAFIEKAETIALSNNYEIGLGNAALRKGAILLNMNDIEAGIISINNALSLFEKLKIHDKVGASLYNLGMAYNQKGEYLTSISFFLKAIESYREVNQLNRLSSCNYNIGLLYENINDYDNAILFYNKALAIDLEIGDEYGVANSYLNIGSVYDNWADYNNAIAYYEKAKGIFETLEDEGGVSYCINNVAMVYEGWGMNKKALDFYHKALFIDQEIDDSVSVAGIMTNVGGLHIKMGDYDSSLFYFRKSLNMAERMQNKPIQSMAYLGIGNVYKNKGSFDIAITYFQKAIELDKYLNSNSRLATDFLNLGDVYQQWDNHSEALNYYNEALQMYTTMGEKKGMATSLYSLGTIYKTMDSLSLAITYYKKAKEINNQLNNHDAYADCIHDLGLVYLKQKKYRMALYNLDESLSIYEQLGSTKSIAVCNISIGKIYYLQGDSKKAIDYYTIGLSMAQEIGLLTEIMEANKGLAACYESLNQINKAYHYFKLYKAYNDSVFTMESSMKLSQIESKFKLESKEQQIVLQQNQLDNKDLKIQQQRIVRNALIFGVLLAALIVFLVIRLYVRKRRDYVVIVNQKLDIIAKNAELEQNKEEMLLQNENLHYQNEEIVKQRNEIENQKTIVQKVNVEVKDSINYAERIQRSMLPDEKILEESLEDYFIFYHPRDIVSGDFYWFKRIKNFVIIAAVDCTGHGVPGAFMSMLGLSFLNEIVSKSRFDSADLILNRMREKVKKALKQTGTIGETRDGMDMALVILNTETKEIEYSGAYNSLYIYRNRQLIEIKADRQPIAIYEKETPFKKHRMQLLKGDRVYLFTDGFADQYGGEHQKKFMSARFKKLLATICERPMHEQNAILNDTLKKWRGDFEQMDDLLVLGFSV